MATPHPTLTTLANQTATQIGFTLRRWWREKTEAAVLRVGVERRLVGAPLGIAVLTTAIPQSPSSRHASPTPVASPARSRPATRTRQQATGTGRTAWRGKS